jgi:TolA-binding protein
MLYSIVMSRAFQASSRIGTGFALLVVMAISPTFAQKSSIYLDAENDFKTGVELYQKEKYTSAQRQFEKLLRKPIPIHHHDELRATAEFYIAACAYENFNKDAEIRLLHFIQSNPSSPKVNNAKFVLGKLNYRNKDYKNTLIWFGQVDVYKLSDAEQAEFYFKSGYAHFQNEDFDKAKGSFKEVKDFSTKYGAPALYYYSHIIYSEKKYETAYLGFKKLEKDETFAPIVPFYLAQILYLQEKYDELIAYAPPLLSSSNTKRTPEIAKILGEAYYRQSKFQESIPYLEQFQEKSGRSSRMDRYQLGYAYYMTKNYPEAIKNFETVVNTEDSLTQLANYHTGDSYLKMGNKPFARNSFKSAAKPDYYRDIKEDALFNYAKLAYDLSYNPYNEAIVALEDYLKKFPDSPRHNEVYDFLTEIYVSTRNYDAALASLDKINPKSTKLQSTYQKVAFYRGIEHFQNGDFNSAIELFDRSSTFPIDKGMVAEATFWKGDGFYRMGNFGQAKKFYTEYLGLGEDIHGDLYPLAEYGLGYCYFKEEKFPASSEHFRKFIKIKGEIQDKTIADACLRTGDCHYAVRDFMGAIEYYDKAIKIGKQDVDYAMFQVALCYGVQGKFASKMEMLKALLQIEKTRFRPDASYELAETFLLQEDYVNAEMYYNLLLKENPESRFAKSSLLGVAMIYYNSNQDDKALPAFKKVVESYPGTPESNEAILKIQKIYVDKGDIDQFEEYTKSRNITGIAQSRLDSATYETAEKLFLKADYAKASSTFGTYLKKFPNGYFFLKALFGKAESDYNTKQLDSAFTSYHKICQLPKNDFTEKSLVRSAGIRYTQGNYGEAATKYAVLEEVGEIPENLLLARTYLMRCYEKMKNWEKADLYATILLKDPKISPELTIESKLLIANSSLERKQFEKALIDFENLRRNNLSKTGAEAQYNIAYIQYVLDRNKECEKSCFDLINTFPSYETWLAKGFILLSDNYLKMNDTYQAKFALQSLIDNSEDIEAVKVAKEKLTAIIAMEEKANQPKPEKPMEINIQPLDDASEELPEIQNE